MYIPERKITAYSYVVVSDTGIEVRIIGHNLFYTKFITKRTMYKKERVNMKGYFVPDGYMGYVNGSYMLFANEMDYLEYISEK